MPFRAGCIRLCDKICQWFSPGTSTYKINHNNIAEILLKVALDTINQTKTISHVERMVHKSGHVKQLH